MLEERHGSFHPHRLVMGLELAMTELREKAEENRREKERFEKNLVKH